MPAIEAIQAATITNARVLENEKIGHIAPGNYADIIAVAGNPLENIRAMSKVTFVMKDGKIYK